LYVDWGRLWFKVLPSRYEDKEGCIWEGGASVWWKDIYLTGEEVEGGEES